MLAHGFFNRSSKNRRSRLEAEVHIRCEMGFFRICLEFANSYADANQRSSAEQAPHSKHSSSDECDDEKNEDNGFPEDGNKDEHHPPDRPTLNRLLRRRSQLKKKRLSFDVTTEQII